MKALIAKIYLAAKQFVFFLGRKSWCVLTKCCELKYLLKFRFVPAIHWTTVLSCIIQCCELRQFWTGSAEQNVVSRAFYIAKQSWKYWRNKRGSNCLTEFSKCTNYDSFIPLSFIHFGIPYNLQPTLQQTGKISCAIEILFSLMYNGMVWMVVCCRYRMPFDANGCVSTLMKVTFYANMLIESDRRVNECRLNEISVFLR